jgi:hypothetical protein
MRGFPAGGDGFVAPDVIDARFTDRADALADGQVYVPGTVTDTEVQFHLWPLGDGRLTLAVFTSVAELVRCCGAAQPWVRVYADRVDECARLCDADRVVWDTEVAA